MMDSVRNRFFSLLFCTFVVLGAFAQQTKKRNLLSSGYDVIFLRQNLVEGTGWVGFPGYRDREGWANVPENIRNKYISQGEAYLGYEWKFVPATTYLEFERTGNRQPNSKSTNDIFMPLRMLFLAELFEGKGRFTDQIINGVWAVCEMTTWSSAAHIKVQDTGKGLPNINEPIIDLNSARNAHLLAWIHYFFHDEFDSVNHFIAERIEYEINRRILVPFYSRDDFRWMGFLGHIVGNWNPYCNSNVLAVILLTEKDRTKRVNGVYKIMRSLDNFTNNYGNDGGCNEGPGYWSMAAASNFEALTLLNVSTNGKVDIFNNPLIKNMGQFIYRAIIEYPYYINFADAGALNSPNPYLVYKYGESIGDGLMKGFGAFLLEGRDFGNEISSGSPYFSFCAMFDMDALLSCPPQKPKQLDTWLPDLQVAISRKPPGGANGLSFAVKGGHNAESHNHNDVGSFILYCDGAPVIIDVGPGTYKRQTFTDERYSIWTMQSAYHNLPVINGTMQENGKAFKAKNVFYESNKTKTYFSLDISGAYPDGADVNYWVRDYRFSRGKCLEISDTYELKSYLGKSALTFMTCYEPSLEKEGTVNLTIPAKSMVTLEYPAGQFGFSYETIHLSDSKLCKIWGGNLYRISLEYKQSNLKGKSKIKIYRQ